MRRKSVGSVAATLCSIAPCRPLLPNGTCTRSDSTHRLASMTLGRCALRRVSVPPLARAFSRDGSAEAPTSAVQLRRACCRIVRASMTINAACRRNASTEESHWQRAKERPLRPVHCARCLAQGACARSMMGAAQNSSMCGCVRGRGGGVRGREVSVKPFAFPAVFRLGADRSCARRNRGGAVSCIKRQANHSAAPCSR